MQVKPTGDIILPHSIRQKPALSTGMTINRITAPFAESQFFGSAADAHEEIMHYRLWRYVAISAIGEKVGEYFPNFSYVKEKPAGRGKLAYTAQQRVFLSAYYNGVLQMTEQEELIPLPIKHRLPQLFKHINNDDWWSQFIFESVMFRRLTGACYWWMIEDGTGRPAELFVVPPQWVDPADGVRDPKTGERLYWRIITEGYSQREIRFAPDELIPWWEKGPISKRQPYSPTRACGEWVENAEMGEQSRNRSFKNSGNPSVAIEFETGGESFTMMPGYDEELIAQVGERFMLRYSGTQRSGEPLVVPPGFKYKPWSHTPREMDYGKSLDQLRDQVLAIEKTPKIVCGIGTEVNRASADAQIAVWCQNVIRPIHRSIAALITEKLSPRFDPRIRVWFDDCVPADMEFELKQRESHFRMGAITPNEIRVDDGREPLTEEGHDSTYLPLNLLEVGAEPVSPPADPGRDDDETDDDREDDQDDASDDPDDNEEDDDDGEDTTDRRQSGGRNRLRPQRDGEPGTNGLVPSTNGIATLTRTAPAIVAPKATWRARRLVRVHTLFLRQHAVHEKRAAVSLRRFWGKLQAAVDKRLEAANTIPDPAALIPDAEFQAEFNKAMRPHWEAALLAGTEIERIAIGVSETRQADEDPSIFVKLPEKAKRFVREFLRQRTAGVWSLVSETTNRALQRVIRRGIQDGEGIEEIKRQISRQLGIQRRQAERIARTEITAALNGGGQGLREGEGIERKLWIATLDNRTRTPPGSAFNHLSADGQTVENDQPFLISGERLQYPGDGRSASAGNVINCRCSASGAVDL